MTTYTSWKPIDEVYIPRSFKTMPGWIKVNDSGAVDLVGMTEDEKYFVSVDRKRVYPIQDVKAWTLVDIPMD